MNAQKSKGRAPMDKKKIAIAAGIGVIILLNILWTVLQSKFTPKLEEVRADLAKVEARLTRLEQGGLSDVADLREEFTALKNISAGYEQRLAQLLKAEEEHLTTLEAQVEAQKARVESIKGHLAPSGE